MSGRDEGADATSAGDRTRRRRTIGFLAPLVHGYFYGTMLSGVLETATSHDCRVIAIQTLDAGIVVDNPDDCHFEAHLAWQHLDAIIVAQNAVTDDYLEAFARTGKPVIAVYRESTGFACPTIVPDNHDGIRAVVHHLVEHGHRDIAFVGRDPADADDWIRYRAYRQTMVECGLEPTEPVRVPWHFAETTDGGAAVRQMLQRKPLPTAAIACTDLTAMAFITALDEICIKVPGDLAVVGFDDIEDAARFRPPLSTVAQSFRRSGAAACELAIDALEGRDVAPGYHCTPVTFVRRESCGCLGRGTPRQPTEEVGIDSIRERFGDDLAKVVSDGRNLTKNQQRELLLAAERVTALFTTALEAPEIGLPQAVDAVAEELRQLVEEAPKPLDVVRPVRRLAAALAERLRPADSAATARLDQLAFDLSTRLADWHLCYRHDRPAAHQNVETQRRYYLISTDLVRQRVRDARSLAWLANTEVWAGCLGIWENGRGGGGEAATLRLAGAHDKFGVLRVNDDRVEAQAFPPASFVDLADLRAGRLTFLLPVRFDGSDWGFLALTGEFDVRKETTFERYNHWTALLTVTLDQELARRSEHTLLEEIRISEERYALAAEASNDGLWDWDLTSGVVYYSARWKSLLGYPDDEITASADEWLSRIHPDDRPAVDQVLDRHFDDRTATMELEYRLRTADGSFRWMLTHVRTMCDEAGRVTRLIGSMTDITERRLLEERLRHDALYDELTGLPNRTLLLDRLEHSIEQARRRPGYAFAVVFLDLDGFKIVNDSLGHQVGDEVLVTFAGRLTAQLRANDTVSRFGGDEFVLLLDDVHDMPGLPATVNRILSELSVPITIGERILVVSATAGIAVSTTGYRTADEFVRDADTAMYRAKALGNGTSVMFDESMHAGAMARLQLESDLRKAVADEQFELYYQPILRLDERRMVGAEALIRWRHPERGLESPAGFLPVAEVIGLTRQIGRWTIRTVCRQIRAWMDVYAQARDVSISINLSNRQFWDPELRSHLRHALSEFEVPPSLLVIEVTEGVIMHNETMASTVLHDLHDDGFRLHVDDFGTGYSSLAMLDRFPIDALKIDRSFVERMKSDTRSRELVRIMMAMGASLGIEVIAEGIETEAEAAMLSEMGCPMVQGYLFSRPLPVHEMSQAFYGEADPRATPPTPSLPAS